MRKALSVVFALLLVVGVIYVVGWGLWMLGTWFLTLPTETMTPVAALVGVLLVPIITYFTNRSLERRRSLETALREHKTKLYDEMMRGLMKMLNLQKNGGMHEPEMLQFFADLTPRLITYGSRGVIQAWSGFRKVSRHKPGDASALMLAFEDLLKAMRKDLGHTVITQPQGELLGVFINDVETIVKKSQAKAGAAIHQYQWSGCQVGSCSTLRRASSPPPTSLGTARPSRT
ncbi:hypothetical protein [Gryllotalpicola sp.]|uniref:hypothetical protein n=1 Tax=Gryllotalpicola sp. TaxID=1932787 RepID=UPI0026126440|nr:hypothetical protein [Gryllotalpicola sp.]